MNKEDRAKDVLKSTLATELTAGDAIARATQGTGAPTWVATRALYSLLDEKKIRIMESRPYVSLGSYVLSPFSLWFWGALVSSLVSLGLIFVTSGVALYLRYVFGSLLVLFLPGYSLIEALYPKKELDQITRLALSIGLSLALVPLTGLVLNHTPFGIRLLPVSLSLAGLTLVFLSVALRRKHAYYKLSRDVT